MAARSNLGRRSLATLTTRHPARLPGEIPHGSRRLASMLTRTSDHHALVAAFPESAPPPQRGRRLCRSGTSIAEG